MLRLSLVNIQKLLDLLEGEFIQLLHYSLLSPRITSLFNEIPNPIAICVIKDESSRFEDSYYVYLIDLIRYCIIGGRQTLRMEYFGSESGQLVLLKPDYTYKYLRLFYKKPYSLHLEFESLWYRTILDSYISNVLIEVNTPYEQWVVNYLSKIQFINSLSFPSDLIGNFCVNGDTDEYISQLETLQAQIIRDIESLMNEYPID